MERFIWRVRYMVIGSPYFGWRTAWAFSLPWVDGELDRDGYTPRMAVREDLYASL